MCVCFFFFKQLNWVCDSAWKATIGQSLFFIGSVVGTQLFGSLADVIGRLPVLIFANIMALAGNSITVFTTNVPVFSISRFISGLAVDSNFLMMYILGKFSGFFYFISSSLCVFLLHILSFLCLSSARVHASIDANIWLKFMYRHFLLPRIDGNTMDCCLFE